MSSTRSNDVVDLTGPPPPRTSGAELATAASRPPAWVMTATFDACLSPMAVVALDGTCLAANRALARLLGREPQELVGCLYQDLTPEEDRPLDAAATERLLGGTGVAGEPTEGPPVTKRLRHALGHLVWVRVQVTLLHDEAGAPWGGVATLTPLDDDGATDTRARWLLRHDPLTGAGNRRLLDEHLADWLTASARATTPGPRMIAALFCDIDDFKGVNDAKGHRHGDQLLVAVSRRLAAGCRDGDVVARVGGDEFVVVSRVDTVEDAESLAERFRRALGQPYALGDGDAHDAPGGSPADAADAHVRVSVGWAVSTPGCTAAELLDRADLDMYRQKALKRGRTTPPR